MTRRNYPVTDRLTQIAALMTADGIDTRAITEAMGFKTRSRTAVQMRQMVAWPSRLAPAMPACGFFLTLPAATPRLRPTAR